MFSVQRALDKYYVMYFPDLRDKFNLMNIYDKSCIFRKKEILQYGLENYRLYFDIQYIQNFITSIKTIDYFLLKNGFVDIEI